MPKKVTIELNERQARVVLLAVEEWFRLRMGQTFDLGNDLAFYGYKKENGNFDSLIERRNHLDAVIKAMMNIAFYPYGSPLELIPEVHIASDIWSELRWQLGPKDNLCSPPFQMGGEPMPKITVEEAGNDG